MTEINQPLSTTMPIVESKPRKSKSPVLAFLFGAFFICMLCGVLPMAYLLLTDSSNTEVGKNGGVYTHVLGNADSSNKLLAIYIDQPILTSSQDYDDSLVTSLLVGQYVFGYKIKDQLMSVATDDSIKGIVFFISSPGGTVTGARAIADGVSYYKEKTGKPVYAYVQDMAASGAYWAAAATDKIYAEQGSLTGSIGVLMGPFEYYDKLVSLGSVGTENGISITYITGGEFKDFGNPTKKMSEEELAIMQKGINTEYDKFVAYVSERRQIPVHVIKEDIKALIYGADEAKAYNLIDEIGNREQVISALASKAGLSDYEVVKEGASTTLFGSLFSSIVHPISLETAKTTTRTCYLCNRVLYLYGNPLAF